MTQNPCPICVRNQVTIALQPFDGKITTTSITLLKKKKKKEKMTL